MPDERIICRLYIYIHTYTFTAWDEQTKLQSFPHLALEAVLNNYCGPQQVSNQKGPTLRKKKNSSIFKASILCLGCTSTPGPRVTVAP